MGAFGRKKKKREPSVAELKAQEAQKKAEESATAQEISEMKKVQARRRLLKRGGLRLLFSPLKVEGPGFTNKLGGGS